MIAEPAKGYLYSTRASCHPQSQHGAHCTRLRGRLSHHPVWFPHVVKLCNNVNPDRPQSESTSASGRSNRLRPDSESTDPSGPLLVPRVSLSTPARTGHLEQPRRFLVMRGIPFPRTRGRPRCHQLLRRYPPSLSTVCITVPIEWLVPVVPASAAPQIVSYMNADRCIRLSERYPRRS